MFTKLDNDQAGLGRPQETVMEHRMVERKVGDEQNGNQNVMQADDDALAPRKYSRGSDVVCQ
jgi:hypothetical protein